MIIFTAVAILHRKQLHNICIAVTTFTYSLQLFQTNHIYCKGLNAGYYYCMSACPFTGLDEKCLIWTTLSPHLDEYVCMLCTYIRACVSTNLLHINLKSVASEYLNPLHVNMRKAILYLYISTSCLNISWYILKYILYHSRSFFYDYLFILSLLKYTCSLLSRSTVIRITSDEMTSIHDTTFNN